MFATSPASRFRNRIDPSSDRLGTDDDRLRVCKSVGIPRTRVSSHTDYLERMFDAQE
jgi:hypothetical protein